MKHVILIEDEDTDAYLMQTYLNKMGFITSVCTNAYQLAEHIISGRVDIIVTDLKLPEIQGVDVIKRTKRIEKNVPLIVVSSYRKDEMEFECNRAGADHYIEKPFDYNVVNNIFRQYI